MLLGLREQRWRETKITPQGLGGQATALKAQVRHLHWFLKELLEFASSSGWGQHWPPNPPVLYRPLLITEGAHFCRLHQQLSYFKVFINIHSNLVWPPYSEPGAAQAKENRRERKVESFPKLIFPSSPKSVTFTKTNVAKQEKQACVTLPRGAYQLQWFLIRNSGTQNEIS